MTDEQRYKLTAAKLELLHKAVLYSIAAVENEDTQSAQLAGHRLCMAAKDFTRAVDSVDQRLWEPPSCATP